MTSYCDVYRSINLLGPPTGEYCKIDQNYHSTAIKGKGYLRGGGGGGGGVLSFFSAYVGSDPASSVHPKKITGISSTPKNI